MQILVTGNEGYIGSVLVPMLQNLGHTVIGFDTGYFKECLISPAESPDYQHKADIRKIEEKHVDGCEAVIHLAGLSNDPLGELNPTLTEHINFLGTLRLAEVAKKVGVRRFVFASSQSIYGVSDVSKEMDEYESEKAPVTEYAKTKWEAEKELLKLNNSGFDAVFFRPSTVFGASPRLRCDIVYNNFLGCAYTTNHIEIKSDGSPWRPIVHVKDVCRAFISGIDAPSSLISGKAYNVGIANGNFTVKDIALAAHNLIPGSDLVFTGEHGTDSRTYRVSFNRIFDELQKYYRPSFGLHNGGQELLDFFVNASFKKDDFYGAFTNRLKKINELVEQHQVSENLEWQ